ncbi:Eaf5p TDEL_0B05550 [Torulaspora delbrueckii]|uniref:Chromatin modification-related protein EAF5 n=1 Tax=Torulaspora delbrueckii TaxID=4950 RepID=G8ZPZ0_TORDE|nr:hypothetical protein TDEL_0B05550 [Torulaspora delbrueckii]CCE90684.1 hypothetical protein TDEL_0B05550 [Torulaspora delbrueckii]
MQQEISELIVLQIIYTLLVLKNQTHNVAVINAKVSLVKLTNEIQNNVLVNQMVDHGETKLDINDILMIVKRVFPNQRISLVDGQLSFHNLQLKELQNGIHERYDKFCQEQQVAIAKLEDEIINPRKKPRTQTNVDPKREKLLQLYRDTVLNKLQAKSGGTKKDLQWLYETLVSEGNIEKIVKEIIEIDRIKNDTPSSVHDLQLVLQRSICDGIMSSMSGTDTWFAARQLQIDFEDTVQFMRRALE